MQLKVPVAILCVAMCATIALIAHSPAPVELETYDPVCTACNPLVGGRFGSQYCTAVVAQQCFGGQLPGEELCEVCHSMGNVPCYRAKIEYVRRVCDF
mmetsp:Transcript_27300/g.64820  ORF Transcript_27300/g.64820 Transcript_27300/m.64820 type:complete len:98 (+) Transcript_27300:32-325(+)|eukprot:CAMPEP_0175865828 /NCGR_PEP_ID=MMETSP0107_2-20121207/33869_1 /TAXON_ID=195067 ORGANISM="Goniomonas pacifica, Strain CCMP1869" /NCGR_SAMPLE_ID=MMETSP0107_2 /ASSEMBLY_ACC=CAM_ASM_000203 /LENGTH=97 /DNA_ID=CAMNT_0017183285 /DNA_START=20 /DNA_END=313 /DNA_ORIENTATION=-